MIAENALHIIDLASRKELHTLTNHAGGVRAIGFSPTEDLLVSAGAEDRIKFWDTRSWSETAPAGQQKSLTALTFAPNGKTFASGAEDGSVQFWNVATREQIPPPIKVEGVICSLTFTSDGRNLAVNTASALQLWDLSISGVLP